MSLGYFLMGRGAVYKKMSKFNSYDIGQGLHLRGGVVSLAPLNLETAVGSRKSAQALDAPGTMKKRSSPIR
jgi:hypothetical protein